MASLIKNEFYKLFHSKKIYIFGLIIIAITAIAAFGMRISGQFDTSYDLTFMSSTILQMLIGFLIQLFSIIIISDAISDEYKSGTLKLSLLHPTTREKLLSAKVIFVFITTLLILLFSMIVSYLISLPILGLNFTCTMNDILNVLKSYIFSSIPLLAFNMIVFFLAINLPSNGASIGASIGLLFSLQIAGSLISKISKYLITSYFTLFIDYSYKDTGLFGIGVIAVYFIVFYILSMVMFKRKDILR